MVCNQVGLCWIMHLVQVFMIIILFQWLFAGNSVVETQQATSPFQVSQWALNHLRSLVTASGPSETLPSLSWWLTPVCWSQSTGLHVLLFPASCLKPAGGGELLGHPRKNSYPTSMLNLEMACCLEVVRPCEIGSRATGSNARIHIEFYETRTEGITGEKQLPANLVIYAHYVRPGMKTIINTAYMYSLKINLRTFIAFSKPFLAWFHLNSGADVSSIISRHNRAAVCWVVSFCSQESSG